MRAEQPKPDIAKMSQKLRLQVCELLKFDPATLSAADEVLVSRVGSLRLLVSDFEAGQLRGEKLDLSIYVEASRELEQALRVDHRMLELGTPAAEQRARDELEAIFREVVGRKDDDDPDDVGLSETERLHQRIAELEAENFRLKWGDAPPSSAELPPPETQPAQPSAENVVPFASTRTADGRPPAHYLKDGQPRDHYSGGDDGGANVPYFPLDPDR
jgi:hypothetical protein